MLHRHTKYGSVNDLTLIRLNLCVCFIMKVCEIDVNIMKKKDCSLPNKFIRITQ